MLGRREKIFNFSLTWPRRMLCLIVQNETLNHGDVMQRVTVQVLSGEKVLRTVQEYSFGAVTARTLGERRTKLQKLAIETVKARCEKSGAYAGMALTYRVKRY